MAKHSTRLWSLIYFAIRAARAASPRLVVAQVAASEPDILRPQAGEILCAGGETIRLARRECELLQILASRLDHFQDWKEIARRFFAVTDAHKDEAGFIRAYVWRLHGKIDGKCTFGIEGRPGYGYRLFCRLLIDG